LATSLICFKLNQLNIKIDQKARAATMSEYEKWIKFNEECLSVNLWEAKAHKEQTHNKDLKSTDTQQGTQGTQGTQEGLIGQTCIKCGSNQLTKTRKQIRSADEGMTTFYHCISCNHFFSS
jgi:DNA-directed RNA polymerase subunit M/transcription elongation factor TFIIS